MLPTLKIDNITTVTDPRAATLHAPYQGGLENTDVVLYDTNSIVDWDVMEPALSGDAAPRSAAQEKFYG